MTHQKWGAFITMIVILVGYASDAFAESQSRSTPMAFDDCLASIQMVAEEVGQAPINIVETVDLRMVRLRVQHQVVDVALGHCDIDRCQQLDALLRCWIESPLGCKATVAKQSAMFGVGEVLAGQLGVDSRVPPGDGIQERLRDKASLSLANLCCEVGI